VSLAFCFDVTQMTTHKSVECERRHLTTIRRGRDLYSQRKTTTRSPSSRASTGSSRHDEQRIQRCIPWVLICRPKPYAQHFSDHGSVRHSHVIWGTKNVFTDRHRKVPAVFTPENSPKHDALIWADHYRSKALENLRRAKTASDNLQEARFLYLAQRYLKLAEAEEFMG